MTRRFFPILLAILSLEIGLTMRAQSVQGPDRLTPKANTSGPGIIPFGSPFSFGGTNAPDTYFDNSTFSSTPVLVDNGKVKIWQQQTPTGSNSEWDIFYMQTTEGPLAGNISANWNVLMNFTLSAPVVFDAVDMQWGVNFTPVSPITNGIGSICCAALSNPILPGPSYYNQGFSVPYQAGCFKPQPDKIGSKSSPTLTASSKVEASIQPPPTRLHSRCTSPSSQPRPR